MKSLRNLSIVALQLSSQVISPPLIGRESVKLSRSQFHRQIHPIFYNVKEINAYRSTFSNFLSSVVTYNKEYKYIHDSFSSSQKYETADSYQFDCCKFTGITNAPCLVLDNPSMTVNIRNSNFKSITAPSGTILLNTKNTIFNGVYVSDTSSPIGAFINANQQNKFSSITVLSSNFIGKTYTDKNTKDAFHINGSSCVFASSNISSNKIVNWGAVFGLKVPRFLLIKSCYIYNCEGGCILYGESFTENSIVSTSFGRVSTSTLDGSSIFWTSCLMNFINCYISPTTATTTINMQYGSGSYYFKSCTFSVADTNTISGESNTFGAASLAETEITYYEYVDCAVITASPIPTRSYAATPAVTPDKTPLTPDRTVSPTQSKVPTPHPTMSPHETAVPTATPQPSPPYVPIFGYSVLIAFIICVLVAVLVFVYKELLEKSSSATIDEGEKIPFRQCDRSDSSERRGNYFALSSNDDSD